MISVAEDGEEAVAAQGWRKKALDLRDKLMFWKVLAPSGVLSFGWFWVLVGWLGGGRGGVTATALPLPSHTP